MGIFQRVDQSSEDRAFEKCLRFAYFSLGCYG